MVPLYLYGRQGDYMKFGFIGAGRAGCSLASHFHNNGLEIVGVYNRSFDKAAILADRLSIKPFNSVCDLIDSCEAIVFSVSDKSIKLLYDQAKKTDLSGKILINLSGFYDSGIFTDAFFIGAEAYSLHPMAAMPECFSDTDFLKDAVFTLEGEGPHREELKSLVLSCGNPCIDLDRDSKAKYHASCVMASNLTLSLLLSAVEELKSIGFSEEEALKALKPLMLNNLNNAFDNGLVKALTGPVDRNDISLIDGHLKAILPEHRAMYRELSLVLTDLAAIKNPDRDYSAMKGYLHKEE